MGDSVDFGTEQERRALADLRVLFRDLQARRGWSDERVATECKIGKRTWQLYLGPGTGEDRLPTRKTAQRILETLRTDPRQTTQASKWLRDLDNWRERRRHPGVMLPPNPDIFVGRKRELGELLAWLDPEAEKTTPVMNLRGMGGAGKTALSLAATYDAYNRGWFTGGALCVDLHGYSGGSERSPSDVLDLFLSALNYRGKSRPVTLEEKVAAWNRVLTERANNGDRVLVVLDNVAQAQVQMITPPWPHRTIITTRSKRSDLIAKPMSVGALERADAVKVLEAAVREGTSDTRVTRDKAAAMRICELAAGLPLALRILGALLRDEPHRQLASMVEELADRRHRLSTMQYNNSDDPERAVRASLMLSYERLTKQEQRALHLLASAPGPDISTDSARPLLGGETPRRYLSNLDRAHLLQGMRGERWQLHDLVRLFAEELPADGGWESELSAALSRLFDHYLHRSGHASNYLTPHRAEQLRDLLPDLVNHVGFEAREDALSWLDVELPNLIASATAEAASGTALRRYLPSLLAPYLQTRRRYADLLLLTESLTRDHPSGEDCPWDVELIHGQALMANGHFAEAEYVLATLLMKRSTPYDAAVAALQSLSVIAREDDRSDDAGRLSRIGLAMAASEDDFIAEAYGRLEAARSEYERNEWDNVLVLLDGIPALFVSQSLHREAWEARLVRANALVKVGRKEEGVVELTAVTQVKDPITAAEAHVGLAFVLCNDSRCVEARTHWSEAAAICRRAKKPVDEGLILGSLATCLVSAGEREAGMVAAEAVLKRFGKHGPAATGTAMHALMLAKAMKEGGR